jgi:murein DD-endopeptidase MepM/ murein hydrolase activator NlpD
MGGRGLFAPALVVALLLAVITMARPAHAGAAPSSAGEGAAAPLLHREVVLERGASLDHVLVRAGIDRRQRRAAEAALAANRDARRLRAGTRLVLTLAPQPRGERLIALHIDLDRHTDLTLLARGDGSFDPPRRHAASAAEDDALRPDLRSITGVVGQDFEASLLAAGLPPMVAHEVSEAFVYDPDFPLRPPAGARFSIVFDEDPGAAAAGAGGALRSVAVTIDGRAHSVYRYRVGNGLVAFVARDGCGILAAHLAKPVPDARISSPWGWRIHPVLDVPEFHKGIDMAAPLGTPVLAAADGTVAFAGRHGNNGVLVKLEHTGSLMTAYSHLLRIASGVRKGVHVKKGEVIGYVGQSGLATGPHLFYEVIVAGEPINPARHDLAIPIRLAGGDLARLHRVVAADSEAVPE